MILEKEDKTNQLVYFGKYTSKKNKAELKNEKKLSKKDYKEKLDVIQLYSSQSKVMDHYIICCLMKIGNPIIIGVK